MTNAESLSTEALFLWGGVGGCAAAVVTFTIPWLTGLMMGSKRPRLLEVFGGMGLLAVHALLGGIAALAVGEATLPRQAIVYGLAWPTVIKGLTETVRAVDKFQQRDGDA